ncbi:RluA family pseudouridine synthase [Coralliovum pocilloporae]|uniref:RluA family pseudouridine synthase n=1 Tax=Coralliovum pocilloporae TaxID=3066369 RepID=UPI0033079972
MYEPDYDTLPSNETDHITLYADEDSDGKRLDVFIASKTDRLSRSRYKTLIKQGQVSIDGATIKEPNHRVNPGNQIDILMPAPEDPEPMGEDIPLDITYEDQDLIVINKPAGLVVHPGAGNWTGTLVNALIHHCGESLSGIGGVKRPGIVHRLDKNTSGLIVVAKHDEAHNGLTRQFADHGRSGPLKRSYHAVVWNVPSPRSGTIRTNIARATNNRLRMAVSKSGKEAITHYRVKTVFPSKGTDETASLVECNLETGRTHQIRVHMTHLGHPLLGDMEYGSGYASKAKSFPEEIQGFVSDFKRQALHAFRLGFEHPVSGQTMLFEADLPQDMKHLVENLSKL